MKTPKKKLAFLLAAVLILSATLAGCRKADPEPSDSELPALLIGSDEYLPFFYVDGDGDFAGIDVDIAREACRRMGLRAEFRQIVWANKNSSLESGEIDCIWGSFTMTGRDDEYIWAGPYMTSRQVLMVVENSSIRSIADLENKRVGVTISSKPDQMFTAGESVGYPSVKALYSFSSSDYLIAALRKEYVDAIAGHETMFLEHIKTAPGNYRILEEPLMEVELGVAFSKNSDGQTADKLSQTLREMYEDGFIASVLERYGVSPERATVAK